MSYPGVEIRNEKLAGKMSLRIMNTKKNWGE